MTISLVATSHGTSVPAARVAVSALIDAIGEVSPHLDVCEAFVDVEQPRVDRVVQSLGGLSVVVPLLLAPGFHVHVDIERAVDGRSAVAARTLGPDARITSLLLKRLFESGATRDDVVVLGAAGSTDVRARQSVDATARALGAAWGSPVPVGHVGGPGLRLQEIIRDASRSGRRVVVASHVLAPGFFYEQMRAGDADVVSRPLLDGSTVEPDMVSLVLDRFAEAAGRLDSSTAAQM
jgi:sirohydrochlorin ferrochelatase